MTNEFKIPKPFAHEIYACKFANFANGTQLVYKVPSILPSYLGVRDLYTSADMRAVIEQCAQEFEHMGGFKDGYSCASRLRELLEQVK